MPGPGSWRREPLPPGWGSLRASVLARDPVCTWGTLPGEVGGCHSRSTDADHINRFGSQVSLGNLRGLCSEHHGIKSGQEGGRASAERRAEVKKREGRPGRAHPGIVKK